MVYLASGVSLRRSDEGYEMANSSVAVVPSSLCNVRGPVTRRMRHSPADGTVLPTSRDYDEFRGRTTHTTDFPGILRKAYVP